MKPSQAIGDYLDGLVHSSARADASHAVRHRAFIAPRLIAGLSMLALLPVLLAIGEVPCPLELVLLVWTVVPLAVACYLSRTGRYESASLMSAAALAAIATAIGFSSGGINSIAALWLGLILLEAAVSPSRRVIPVAALLALSAAALLVLAAPAPNVSAIPQSSAFVAVGVASALLYAAAIAFAAERVARVAARRAAAEADRMRLLAGHMSDVVTRHDAEGRVLSVSPNVQDIFGFGAGEMHGLGLFDRVHTKDRAAFRGALRDAAVKGVSGSVDFRLRRSQLGDDNIGFTWVTMQCKSLPEPPGAGHEVVAVMREVSRQKAQEQALIDARADVERSNAGKSKFLAVLSHDLRTPLNAIIGFSEMLANADELRMDGDRRREYGRLINEAGCQLLTVVNRIHDVSRLAAGEFEIAPERCRPAPLIEGACELITPKARDLGITLHRRVPQELPEIVADPHALDQIVTNLVANALKFTHRGGAVTIEARRDGETFVMSVADTGVGSAPEHFGRLGDPFFQVRGSYARTHEAGGLGLSIVEGLVKLHGGEVDVCSRVGEGTRVTVRLPIDGTRGPSAEPVRNSARLSDPEYPAVPSPVRAAPARFQAAMRKSA